MKQSQSTFEIGLFNLKHVNIQHNLHLYFNIIKSVRSSLDVGESRNFRYLALKKLDFLIEFCFFLIFKYRVVLKHLTNNYPAGG